MELGPDWEWGAFLLEQGGALLTTVVAFGLAVVFARWQMNREDERRKERIAAEALAAHRDREYAAMVDVYNIVVDADRWLHEMVRLNDLEADEREENREREELERKADEERSRSPFPSFGPYIHSMANLSFLDLTAEWRSAIDGVEHVVTRLNAIAIAHHGVDASVQAHLLHQVIEQASCALREPLPESGEVDQLMDDFARRQDEVARLVRNLSLAATLEATQKSPPPT